MSRVLGQLARTDLRGRGRGNASPLPGQVKPLRDDFPAQGVVARVTEKRTIRCGQTGWETLHRVMRV